VPGRDLEGVHFAMEFLPQQNKINAGDKLKGQLRADGKHVIVIGGGDTGSDCVGTSNRHGAAASPRFELMAHTAGPGRQAADLALLAVQAAHLFQPRGGLPARVSPLPPRNSSARRASSPG
jgi:NADPH-dependent glutamate synthase beta subunit-like oxidoreductase